MIQQLDLKAALLYYRGDPSAAGDYWQIHSVEKDKAGVPVLREGIPVQRRTLAELCKEILPSLYQNIGWIDPGLLAYGAGSEGPLLFWRPSIRRSIYFGRTLKLESGIVTWPALVFLARPKELHVFAVNADQRPELDTPLLMPPFFNIYEDCRVCLGTTRAPATCWPDETQRWGKPFIKASSPRRGRRIGFSLRGGPWRLSGARVRRQKQTDFPTNS
ncbi:MAG: hypothetical protein MPW17_22210 (plasmid) [Candidatus Manganitrophus sp.]|nr:MAG: hypothetical protein MPW17_22210 [Candidatus Manganitrophus sp.]